VRISLLAVVLLGACAPAGVTPKVARTVVRTISLVTPAPIVRERSSDPSDPGELAGRVHLRCADTRCPEGVGMLVRAEGEELQRCTATLIGPDLALTASHCLPPAARHAGASCRGTWLTFAAADGHPAEWAACRGVVRARPVRDEEVMRTDVALLRLARSVDREPLAVALVPIAQRPEVVVGVVAVSPHPIYPSQHELSTRLCRVATRDSAVAAYGEEAARVGWLIECPSHPGNSGSPVVDARGRVRAVLHGGSAPLEGVGVTSGLSELPAEASTP
jgi:hypothetical protein